MLLFHVCECVCECVCAECRVCDLDFEHVQLLRFYELCMPKGDLLLGRNIDRVC